MGMSKLYRAGKSLFRYFVPAGNRMCVVPDEKIQFPSDMEYLGIPIPVIAEKYRQVIEEVLETARQRAVAEGPKQTGASARSPFCMKLSSPKNQ